jgi:hypothetical protein
MVHGKVTQRILKKDPPKGDIKKTDVISVNDNFVSKLYKVKILSAAKSVSSLRRRAASCPKAFWTRRVQNWARRVQNCPFFGHAVSKILRKIK